ncbi:MAG: zinc ribbon domain-containing protein [Acidobacteriota bacterium]
MDDESLVICQKCMAPNPETAQICSECGANLDLINNLDPMSAIYSEGAVISKGVHLPLRPIVLIMTWVIFLPWLFGAALGMLSSLGMAGTNGWLFFWIFTGNAALAGVALFKVTRNYLNRPPRPT